VNEISVVAVTIARTEYTVRLLLHPITTLVGCSGRRSDLLQWRLSWRSQRLFTVFAVSSTMKRCYRSTFTSHYIAVSACFTEFHQVLCVLWQWCVWRVTVPVLWHRQLRGFLEGDQLGKNVCS